MAWTAEKMAAKRAALQKKSAGAAAANGTSLLEQAYDDYRLGNNLGFAEEQGGSLGGSGLTLSATSGGSSPKGGAMSGLYANAAQKLKSSYADYSQPDAFDRANQWFDQPRNQELVRKMTETKGTNGYTSYAQMGTSVGGSADPFRKGNVVKKYSTADLEKMGYSVDEIAQARNYLDTMESIPEWKQATRRTANTIGGIADTVAAAPLLGAEYLGQAVKNIRQSSVNRKALAEEVAANPREKNLYDRLMETDMDYQPKYSTGDLLQQGFTRQEIEDMRSRIAGTEASEGINPEKSVGYQLYNRGQQLTGAAQSGQTDMQKAAQGIVTSAAENLAVAAVNPAAVLPVLSAQGAAESMGKAAEQGDSAGKALAGGGLKFGAGWAINSVGVADLAKTMGSDYARNTLAGKLADAVRGLAGSAELTQKYPAIANAISGGVDNAMQAFVETYADKAIDAALGDSEAADNLLKKETFFEALESGLSGGASGALGGAVGTGLARLGGEPLSQRSSADSSPTEGSPWQDGQAVLNEESPVGREVQGTEAAEAPAQEAQRDGTGGSPSQSKPDGFASSPEGRASGETAKSVLTAIKNDGREVFYDVVNIEPTKIKASDGTAEGNTSGSKSTETIGEAGANGRAVENAGENVESDYRETYGLRETESREAQQSGTEGTLRSWGVSETAAKEIGQKLPEGTNAERYAAAASTLYRLGQMEDVKSFDRALELAGSGSGMAANVNYVLSSATGRNALEIAYIYGKGEAESRWEKSRLGGTLTGKSLTGWGETRYEGSMRNENEAASRVIELNAAATGTTTVLKNVLQNEAGQTDSRVRAYVDTETGKIFFGDSATDVFGTALHEDWHWYNALDAEGGKQLMDHALTYLAQKDGFETLDEMIRDKMSDYAGQGLTYEEAAEELVGDAWRGIFSTEEDFKRWVEFQRGQAEKNAGKTGTIHKVMNRVKEMLDGIVSRAKEILSNDPENAAARRAQRLAEKERRILQDEYFAHAEKAMDNLRAAKENAAALKNESAAEGRSVRYSVNPEYAQDIDDWNRRENPDGETFVLGNTGDTLQQLGARENDIYMNSSKINIILKEHPEMTLEEIKRIPEILDNPVMVLTSQNKGRSRQNTRLVMFGDVKAQDGRPVLCVLDLRPVENHIVINDMQKVTSAYTKDMNPVQFVRGSNVMYVSDNKNETTALLQSLGFQLPVGLQRYGLIGGITYAGQGVKLEGVPFAEIETSGGTYAESGDNKKRTTEMLRTLDFKMPSERQLSGSTDSVTHTGQDVKMEGVPFREIEASKKEPDHQVRQEPLLTQEAALPGSSELTITDSYNLVKHDANFTKYFSDEVAYQAEAVQELQKNSRELESKRRELKEERNRWMSSEEVKAIEAKKKSYGLFSAEGKAYRESEEYQNYLKKRKEFNRRGAELDDRIGEIGDRLREANARLEARRKAVQNDRQIAYDAKAKEAGGKAEYRRQLAEERFGTTDAFERAGYILPDGRMLDFAQNGQTRDTDHRALIWQRTRPRQFSSWNRSGTWQKRWVRKRKSSRWIFPQQTAE